MPQAPETILCPDEHMCEDKDICPQLWGQEAAAGARLISKIKLWSLFIKSPIIRTTIKLWLFKEGDFTIVSILPWLLRTISQKFRTGMNLKGHPGPESLAL